MDSVNNTSNTEEVTTTTPPLDKNIANCALKDVIVVVTMGTHAALKRSCNTAIKYLLISFVLMYGLSYIFTPYDTTDPVEGGRSGLSVKTDHLTKCQYLVNSSGGMTARIDLDGQHMGCNFNE